MYKTVNIEAGMPTADEAVRRLTYEISAARRDGASGIKIIHGYGSSGVGGRLRTELRRYLARQKDTSKIKLFIEGERLSIFDADTRAGFRYCPELRGDSDMERYNNGVTVIIL
ncbi:MAG: Smr/MutS family protein [Clostridia bacterium]